MEQETQMALRYNNGQFTTFIDPCTFDEGESVDKALDKIGYKRSYQMGTDMSWSVEVHAYKGELIHKFPHYRFWITDGQDEYQIIYCQTFIEYIELLNKFTAPALCALLQTYHDLYDEAIYHIMEPIQNEVDREKRRLAKKRE